MLLCVDTITPFAGITLVNHGKGTHKSLPDGQVAEQILPTIDAVLAGKLEELTGIIVIKGPGSFTALRVGISVANTLAHQLNIPILGLRTEAFYRHMTEETDFIFLQSMNKDEIYVWGFGQFQGALKTPIVSIHQQHPAALDAMKPKYIGQLTEDHATKVPKSFQKITDLKSIEDTWMGIAQASAPCMKPNVEYDLIQPYYGKAPTITKSKRKV
jgi:tRNA threonylcarbamoyl adenosine modification protein YeaZ